MKLILMGIFDGFMNRSSGLSNNNLKTQVDAAISYFEQGNISALQQNLFEIYSGINRPGGGRQILEFNQKDRLGEIFTLCLRYDWMHDSDIREVWAENGFYCIATYINKDAETMQDVLAGTLDLFLLLHYGKNSLTPKISDILHKASLRANRGIGIESNIFDEDDFENGADWLIREFSFFAATWISKIERQHPQIISPDVRPAYETAKTDYVFATISPDKIMVKMQFIAKIIGSILSDM